MSNIAKCLDGMVEEGRLTRADAEAALQEVKRLERRYAETMSQTDAERAAVDAWTRELQAKAKRQKHLTNLQILATARVVSAAEAHPEGVSAGAMAHLTKDMHGKARHSNVEYRKESILGQLHRMFGDGLEAFHAKYAGLVQDKPGLRAFIRELYGQDSGHGMAKAAAKAWRDTAEFARTRFNNAGGDIGKLEDWRVPQSHDRARVKKAGYGRWRAMFGEKDIALMKEAHGLDDMELELALQQVHQTISTNGLSSLKPGSAGQGKKLANRHQESRFLRFADAESWLRYNDEFGAGDIYGLLTGHLDRMAGDIAQLEVLGPNPDAMVRHLYDLARIEEAKAADPSTARRLARAPLRFAERPKMILDTYNVVSGKINAPESELVAKMFGGLRNILSTAQLGSAPLSAITDLKFIQKTAAWNGLETTKILKRQLALLNPANAEDRAFAARSGLVAQAWVTRALSAKRFSDEVVGDGWTSRLVDGFHRISGLTPWTQAGRWAFGLEFMGTLADHAHLAFDRVPPNLRRALDNYGITAELWDAARKFDMIEHDGARFLNAAEMAQSADPRLSEAGSRIHEMVLTETDFAVLEPDARVRAMVTQGSQRGSVVGELWRSSMMYKSFSITVLTTHMMRGVAQPGLQKGVYIVDLVLGLMVMGAVAIQMKQIASGKDPRDMADPNFLGAAFFQGGGLGIFGDFLYAALARNGQDLERTFRGSVAGLGYDVSRLAFGNLREAADGRKTRLSAELVRFAQRYTPGSTLWYARLGMERLIWNRLQMMADPDYRRGFAQMRKRAMTDYHQDYYWRPGELAPDRAPDPSAAIKID